MSNPFEIITDSSIYTNPNDYNAINMFDGLIRIGVVQRVFNDQKTGELRYLVEAQINSDKIPLNCVMLRRFGGVYNYEDYIFHGYNINDKPDPVNSSTAKAGDKVLVGQLNGQGREGVILGGLTHPARHTAIKATIGPQYDAEFNGIHTNINANGEWTLTFKGQPTNLSTLNNTPSGPIPSPTYDTTVGSSFMKFDMTGGWIINDNATSDPQSISIDKANGLVNIIAGQASLVINKSSQTVTLTCNVLTVSATKTISETTSDYSLLANSTLKLNSPKIAIGNGGIELLDQLSQLIDKIGALVIITPVGPCTPVVGAMGWADVVAIQSKIKQIKGSL